jgi:hypothetical protein
MVSSGKFAKQLKLLYSDDINVRCYSHSGKQFGSFLYNFNK